MSAKRDQRVSGRVGPMTENRFRDADGNVDWEALKSDLDQIPANEVRDVFVELGAADSAALSLVELAQNAPDPGVRESVGRYLLRNGLGMLLIDEDDDDLPEHS